MDSNAKGPSKPSTEEAVKKALKASPGATAEAVASAAGIGRSTAGKALARLTQAGEVSRTEGGREEGRRLPDRYSLRNAPAHAVTGSGASEAQAKKPGGADVRGPVHPKCAQSNAATPATAPAMNGVDRLRPGQLEGLVITYLKENTATGPHGPTGIARALERSSGAVGNCLVRLVKAKRVRQVTDKPRRYSLAA
jgi:hypothetical protein